MATHFPAQMPNNCKKGPNLRREAKLATAQTSDDFDGMLAEFRSVEAASISASSITGTAITSIYTSSSASRASTVSPFSSNLQVPKVRVQEAEIVEAIKEADIPKLERWARQGVRVSDAMTLYIACGAGNVAVMRCLVKQLGADVNQMTKVYGRPLMVAADNGRLDIMRCLVNEFGVDVNQTSMNGSTALHCAAQGKHLDAMRVLVKELGADVNKADCEGSTPLQIAAQFGNHDVLQCLLKELGSNVNLVSRRDGGSALHSAAQEGHMNIVRILIENHGADPNIATLVGSTPLMLAIYHPKVNIRARIHIQTRT
jgi:ankyrin repeat protein